MHAIAVLFASANSEGSGESAHARVCAARIHNSRDVYEISD